MSRYHGRPASTLELRRRERGFTQEALSRVVFKLTGQEITQNRISMLERGLWPHNGEKKALATVLDCSEAYLFPYVIDGAPQAEIAR